MRCAPRGRIAVSVSCGALSSAAYRVCFRSNPILRVTLLTAEDPVHKGKNDRSGFSRHLGMRVVAGTLDHTGLAADLLSDPVCLDSGIREVRVARAKHHQRGNVDPSEPCGRFGLGCQDLPAQCGQASGSCRLVSNAVLYWSKSAGCRVG